MAPENKSFFRFPAEKVAIRELEEGEYIEEKEQDPNYVVAYGHKKIFRANVIATIIHKELRGSATSILIDDGTGKIVLRMFEENKAALDLEVGDVVLIVGKVRIFNQEKYIFPEIIRKTDPIWLKVRSLELQEREKDEERNPVPQKIELKNNESRKEIIKEQKETALPKRPAEENAGNFEIIGEEIEENDPLLPFQKLSKLISLLDKGDGAMIEEIIEKSSLEKTEELIEKMLENGDIFQNMPGKVRLL